jgi:uncharacterized protein YndB with AHSA1/START domain
MNSVQAAADLNVRKSIVVAAPVDRTWKVFTGMAWWPLTDKHIGKADAKEAVLEPRLGGRWLERGVDGSECDWGRVLLWEPPKRLVLAWQISPEWKFDPSIESEVEILFTPDGTGTRVDLEHRKLETYGARAAEMAGIFASPSGWSGILGDFAKAAA